MQMISLIWLTYLSPHLTLLQTLVMADTMAWLVVGSSVKGMDACVLLSGARMEGPRRETADMGGGMFSWSESLNSLGVGLLGCGKLLSQTQMKVAGVAFCTRS